MLPVADEGMRMSEFFDQYKRPEWQRKRLEVMEAADFTCQECESAEKTLNVHHTFYLKGKKPWEYPTESLQCLCEDCHSERHTQAAELKLLLGEISSVDIYCVLGYVKGLILQKRAGPDDGSRFSIRTAEEAGGLADVYRWAERRGTAENKIVAALHGDAWSIDHGTLNALFNPRAQGEQGQ